MFRLFKYNARNLFKTLMVFYVILFASALLARATSGLSGSFAATFAKGFTNGLFISMIASLLINNFMRLMVRVRANMYGAESYLTHALPVKTRTIWLSWWVVGLLSTLVSFVAIVAACSVAYADFGPYVAEHLEPVAEMLGVAPAWLLTQVVVVVMLEFWTLISVGMLAIVLGQKANDHQVLRTVIYAVVIYWLLQVAIIGTLYLMALNNDQLMAVFRDAPITDFNSLSSVLTIATIFYGLAIGAMGVASVRCLRRGVNVE